MSEETKTISAPDKVRAALAKSSLLRLFRKRWRRLYGPFSRASARLLDYLSATDVRRGRTSLAMAIAINLIVLTLLSTFARVRIWIPNAPSDTIQVTLVETLPFDLPLRDPDPQPIPEPEPEPEPEIVEELEPEPEPEPDPVPEPEEPAAPEPEPEPEAQPEPQLNLNRDPQFALPADAPEPLIPDPAPAAEDDLTLPEPQEDPLAPFDAAEQPLISVEDEASQTAGLEEILGQEEADGDSEPEERDAADAPEVEPELTEAPSGDDMFDEEPVFGRRTFILPQVALPTVDAEGKPLPEGVAAILPGDSGVVAIFCPEQFSNEDKQKECAGRTEIRSGWRPGASGEDWSRATELLKRDRKDGVTGPTIGPVAAEIESRRQEDLLRDLRDPRRSDAGVNNLPDAGDDNLMRGVEGNRPAIGPGAFEPSWTLRDRPEDISKKDLEELERRIKEAEDGN